VSGLNLFGYFIAFLAVCWYNYQKLQAAKAAAGLPPPSPSSASEAAAAAAAGNDELIPLKIMTASSLDKPVQT
jgi:hypothetical protein